MNETLCTTCPGGVPFCSQACPAIACPILDAGPEVDGAPGDAGRDAAATGCPATASTACIDCGGTGFCVSGPCPALNCAEVDSGAAPDAGGAGCGGCGAGQLCVHPSCGGGNAPPCDRLDDAGGCAAGWTYSATCQFTGSLTPGPGCRPPPCVPPAPFCASVPASCGGSVRCTCLPNNVCTVTLPGGGITGGQCQSVSGQTVTCGSA
jgi:hypothetical protein